MKKQRNHINILFKRISLSGLFSLSILTGMNAQDYMENGRFIVDGNLYTVPAGDQKIRDIVVPPQTSGKYLYLKLEGADGGRVRRETSNKWSMGGEGATVIVYAKIGNAAGQIPEGAHVRFIVGEGGSSRATSSTDDFAAGSGGGTGVAFRPKVGDPWQLLAVAGAGSGGLGNCCSSYYHGDPGQGIVETKITSSNGSGGRVIGPIGVYGIAGAGGGAFSDGETANASDSFEGHITMVGGKAGWPGGPDSGIPSGGAGGQNSGWGFGGGGSSKNDTGEFSGGGGGYTGGNVLTKRTEDDDAHKVYSYGGGSFYNQDYVRYGTAIVNGTTEHPDDGHVDYQFLDVLPAEPAIKLAADPQKCIDVESDKLDDGSNMQLWDCEPFASTQSWIVDGYEIKLSYDGGKCINVDGGSTDNGANVRIRNCNKTKAQKWIYDGLSKQFRSALNFEKCLNDAYGGRTDNGTNIQLWNCLPDGGNGNQWSLNGAITVNNLTGIKKIIPIKDVGLALQSASGAQWGSNVQLGTKDGNDSSERWVFDGGQIQYGPSRDLCITPKDLNTDNGTNIELRGCSDSDAKKWVYNGMTQQFHLALDPDKCLEVATSGVYEKGMNIQLMDCNQHSRQKFDIK